MLKNEEIKNYVIAREYKDDNVKIYLDEINKIPMLSEEETEELFKQYNNGDKNAKNKLIESNLRLVVAVAKIVNQKVIHRAIPESIDLIDMIQEGNFGLITAIEKFDITKGYQFSTYAVWWIRKSINDAIINKGKIIRKPHNLSFELDKIYKERKELSDKLLRQPTNQELADILGMELTRLEYLLNIPQKPFSIDAIISEEGFTIKDVLEDGEIDIEKTYIETETRGQLYELINELPEREKEIIIKRYNILGMEVPRKILAEKYEISQERVRQIELNAIAHLKEKAKDRLNNPFR